MYQNASIHGLYIVELASMWFNCSNYSIYVLVLVWEFYRVTVEPKYMSGKEWAWMLWNVSDWSTILIASYFVLCIHLATLVCRKVVGWKCILNGMPKNFIGWRESVFV